MVVTVGLCAKRIYLGKGCCHSSLRLLAGQMLSVPDTLNGASKMQVIDSGCFGPTSTRVWKGQKGLEMRKDA